MDDELNDAIESARSAGIEGPYLRSGKRHSRALVLAILKGVLGELTDHRTVREVVEELATVKGF